MGGHVLSPNEGQVIYVAVGTDLEKQKLNLLWVLKSFPGASIVLLHVHVPSKWIPLLGTKIFASMASTEVVRKQRKDEKEKMKELMLSYINFCEQRKAQVRALVTIRNVALDGLQQLIKKHQIKRLVLSSRSMAKQEALLSCCQIILVNNGRHISTCGASFSSSKADPNQDEAQDQYVSALSHVWDSDECLQFDTPPNEQGDEIVKEREGDAPVAHGESGSSMKDYMHPEALRQQLDSREEEVKELRRMLRRAEEDAKLALERMASLEQEMEGLREENSEAMRENLALKTQQHCAEFSPAELRRATNNWHTSHKIGGGGYGTVYRGVLRHTPVAIKTLNPESKQGPAEFRQEVLILSKMRHSNIVILYGVCSESSALIYEYLPRGNLDERLSCKNKMPPLSASDRLRIIGEQHSAVVFLHSHEPHAIVHSDLKPQNILLDANDVSRLGDFGTARLILRAGSSEEEVCRKTNPMGTMGYMDPMFLTDGMLTPQSDVYSFGVVVLRLLTGQPALGIRERVEEGMRNGGVRQLLDASAGQWPEQAEKLVQLASRCCSMERSSRPSLLAEEWRILDTLRAMAVNRLNSKKV
ncbi:U-box domain-containing protein 33 [Apostasia shenzhenica]|uniref:RING-type E3 ubiquitin transferase n=1 Tax=Apostasia shenzhenica TaxID=1088818 RepID=A0A2I0AV06_9ASPA|nr:U-box domain-containing protein 33 [Apostasia shenzhenica]